MFRALSGRTPGDLDSGCYREFAVAAPYLPESESFLFQVRSQKLNRQPGEVCFPGGAIEEGESPREAAVRETAEELLVPGESVEVIAPLDILSTPFHTRIHPFLVYLPGYRFTYSRDEVQAVFTVPVSFFLETDPQVYYNTVTVQPESPDFPHHLLGMEPYPWGKSRYPVLFYQYEDKVIWGMTAQFVQNIVQLYQQRQSR